jgi:hypothetical protein
MGKGAITCGNCANYEIHTQMWLESLTERHKLGSTELNKEPLHGL